MGHLPVSYLRCDDIDNVTFKDNHQVLMSDTELHRRGTELHGDKLKTSVVLRVTSLFVD